MLPKELYSKIQRLHFRTRFLANDLFAGQYVSAFKGKGMEFVEVREYRPGDDVRDIDWNVTARFGHPFVKVFHEERQLTVMLVLDLSASHLFGTRVRFKRELAAEAAGLLAFLAIRTNDKVGAILFSSKVDRFIAPRKGAGHVWRLIKEVYSHEAGPGVTDMGGALDHLNKVVPRHAIVFLISDFLVDRPMQSLRIPLSLAARRHDVTALRVQDPAERSLPRVGLAWIRDPETGQVLAVNTSDRRIRQAWEARAVSVDRELRELCNRAGVGMVDLFTHRSVVEPLTAFFRRRETRR